MNKKEQQEVFMVDMIKSAMLYLTLIVTINALVALALLRKTQ